MLQPSSSNLLRTSTMWVVPISFSLVGLLISLYSDITGGVTEVVLAMYDLDISLVPKWLVAVTLTS